MSRHLTTYNPPSTGLSTRNSGGARLPAALRRDLTAIQERTVLQAARVQAKNYVTAEALYAITNLSELEGQLATMSPLAASRLEFLVNAATLDLVQIVRG